METEENPIGCLYVNDIDAACTSDCCALKVFHISRPFLFFLHLLSGTGRDNSASGDGMAAHVQFFPVSLSSFPDYHYYLIALVGRRLWLRPSPFARQPTGAAAGLATCGQSAPYTQLYFSYTGDFSHQHLSYT